LSGLYKTIILDELNPTVDLELLPVESIHQTLLKKPADTEVVVAAANAYVNALNRLVFSEKKNSIHPQFDK